MGQYDLSTRVISGQRLHTSLDLRIRQKLLIASIRPGNVKIAGILSGFSRTSARDCQNLSVGGALYARYQSSCGYSGATENPPLYGLVIVHSTVPFYIDIHRQ